METVKGQAIQENHTIVNTKCVLVPIKRVTVCNGSLD